MKIVLAAGGTGGHIYPALSLAHYLINQGCDVLFISSDNEVAHNILDHSNLKVLYYQLQGISRDLSIKGIKKNFKTLHLLAKCNHAISQVLDQYQPDIIMGFGSYISFIPLKYGIKHHIKTLIHEQNSYPGLVNRYLANKVDAICYTYENSLMYFKIKNPQKLLYTANPRLNEIDKTNLSKDFILVLGGSLGASKLIEIGEQLALHTQEKIVLVTGKRYHSNVKRNNLIIKDYLDDAISYLKKAKVIITRGGATTLLECCYLGKNTIVIPSPNVVKDHQTLNAKELAKNGYLRYISEDKANINTIIKLINTPFKPIPFKDINPNAIIYQKIKELYNA